MGNIGKAPTLGALCCSAGMLRAQLPVPLTSSSAWVERLCSREVASEQWQPALPALDSSSRQYRRCRAKMCG
jgi:hypothetical protein